MKTEGLKHIYFIAGPRIYRFLKSDTDPEQLTGELWARSGLFGLFQWKWRRCEWMTLARARRSIHWRPVEQHYFPSRMADIIYRLPLWARETIE